MTEPYTLTIRGNRLPDREIGDRLPGDFTVRAAYELQNNRARSMSYPENLTTEIVNLRTEEGVEWLGLPDDLPEVYGTFLAPGRGDSGGFLVPNTIEAPADQTRGFLQEVKAKVLEIITRRTVDSAARTTAGQVAHRIDAHLMARRGLFAVSARGELGAPVTAIRPGGKALVFIHGTISNFEQGFAGIEPRFWQQIHERYDGRVYAFNHATLTVSPVGNALELLAALPDDVELDLITHSRGGLVADALARCDGRLIDKGFRAEEIEQVRADYGEVDADGSELLTAMEKLGDAAASRNVRVDRVVRVACPAQGTVLLSERLDHYLNAMLALVGQGTGLALTPLYQLVKEFILEVIDQRSDPAMFPGLYAMIPDRAYSKVNNNPTLHLPCKLFSIVGDADVGGGVLKSLKVILANLYYWRENDLVVNSSSMSKGILRREVNMVCEIAGERVDHFSYFDDSYHMEIVVALLNDQPLPNRAVLRNLLVESGPLQPTEDALFEEVRPQETSRDKPLVVLLPGIMGSHLYAGDACQWVSLKSLYGGGFVDRLGPEATDVEARSLIGKYYWDVTRYLIGQGLAVQVVPYDWRLSLEKAAEALGAIMAEAVKRDQPVMILAHSMGGLVVREWMRLHPDPWAAYRERAGSRVVLLGTPWRGSHLITEILTGLGKRVRQLALLDFSHSKREVLEVLVRLPGLYELLPLDAPELLDMARWEELRVAVGEENMAPVPEEMLNHLRKYGETVTAQLDAMTPEDWERFVYVAGSYPETVDGYEIRSSIFRPRGRVRFHPTAQGDGSVSWARGIPRGLEGKRVFYTPVQHAELANDPRLFSGLLELLRTGDTEKAAFSSVAPVSGRRSAGDRPLRAGPRPGEAVADLSPVANMLGVRPRKQAFGAESEPIRVTVYNGDLRWAAYPIMIGHFGQDGIVSAERALDLYLDNTLSERHMLGFYPGEIGEQDVIIAPGNWPRGALIVGLGDKDDLTGFNLSRTVEKGVLKYAVFCRDNQLDPDTGFSAGISTVLIGSNYGQLPMRECIRSILLGVQRANHLIRAMRSERRGLRPVTNLQFVDYYEDRAYECFKVLREIARRDRSLPLSVGPTITTGLGSRKRFLREDGRSWWQTFTTRTQKETALQPGGRGREYLDFTAENRTASISTDSVQSNLGLARYLAAEMARESRWDATSAKVIFEMLIPNRYKDFIRNHRNISWKMDRESAAFPWEMFHDPQYDDRPTFVRAGMIRQLYSRTATIRPALVREHSALVVGISDFASTREKDYGGVPLGDIPAAKTEGEAVADQLLDHGFDVVREINTPPLSILKNLLGRRNKIVHIASHGMFDLENDRIGIEIRATEPLTPGTLRQISAVPELVFINCCHLGKIDPAYESYYRNRHRLAANVGTELIELGVKAVVVAGWAVNDGAAATFAATFYEEILSGNYFGEAVLRARQRCFDQHPETNTWGAYQCYGDPFYRSVLLGLETPVDDDISLEQELLLEMENLISRSGSLQPNLEVGILDALREDAHRIVTRAEATPYYTARLKQLEAKFHILMGNYEVAIQRMRELFEGKNDNYGVAELYTYCNIRAKHLVNLRQQPGGARQHEDTIERILDDLRLPNPIVPGPVLLASRGSTYKRAAILSGITEARKYLRTGALEYLKAGRLNGLEAESSIYYVTSFLTLATFCNANVNDRIDIPEELGMKAATYLEDWLRESPGDASYCRSVYFQLADTQLRLCKLIITATGNVLTQRERNDLTEEIIKLNEQQLATAINVRDSLGEIEHLKFVVAMCDLFGGGFTTLRVEANRILLGLQKSWPQ